MSRARDAGETFETAKDVRFQASVNDEIDFRNDLDVFRFRLDAGEGVILSTENGGDFSPDTVLALYDRRGNLIDVDDDSGGDGGQSLIEYVNEGNGGRFYAVVSSYSNFPEDDIGQGSLDGPDYTGGGDRADVGERYTLNFEYFGIV